ncbi:MAG: biotin/lipoyl-binding protein, partial [Bacteroidota bacterium]
MEQQHPELRSDDVQEILGTPPSWLVRWGTVLMLLVMAGLLFVFYKWEYSDTIVGDLILSTTNPPELVYARAEGRVKRLFVQENQKVQPDDVLAVMENSATYEDVNLLTSVINSLQTMERQTLDNYFPPRDLELGEIEAAFAKFKS